MSLRLQLAHLQVAGDLEEFRPQVLVSAFTSKSSVPGPTAAG